MWAYNSQHLDNPEMASLLFWEEDYELLEVCVCTLSNSGWKKCSRYCRVTNTQHEVLQGIYSFWTSILFLYFSSVRHFFLKTDSLHTQVLMGLTGIYLQDKMITTLNK